MGRTRELGELMKDTERQLNIGIDSAKQTSKEKWKQIRGGNTDNECREDGI